MIDHDERDDYRDGPPRGPWLDWPDWFVIVGLGLIVAFIVFVYACRAFVGPSGN